MSDLSLDYDVLTAAAVRMDQILATFAGAQSVAHDTAELTGHDGLAAKVREFADAWDLSRARLVEELGFIGEAFRAVNDTFQCLDDELAGQATSVESAGGGR
ncbi:MAG: hypothetical protein J7480_06420 [Microbacteriaceae bacterium]|nr:hypothetical protein [Microbacteriaceae bacterium]